ncbi:MAG: putative DNA-binding domain-containing protein [Bauldia sp.]|nr:putative DNA-binding domain-containing protein [Bauldia sp.]
MLRSLSDVQAEFAAALRDPTIPPPRDVVGPDGRPAPRRFAVYRNNVFVALGNALAGSFPAVERIVGEDFFRAMARAYIIETPPTSPVLMDYGVTFPDFIARFEPASSLPYLPDVARLERAWRESYHAADREPLAPAVLAAVPSDALPDTGFVFHPSLRLVTSRFPIISIWRMNVSDVPPSPVDFSLGEDALIVRPDAEVEVRVVPPGGAAFVNALAAGETLGSAAVIGEDSDSRFDLSGNLAGLIGAGAIVDLRRQSEQSPS